MNNTENCPEMVAALKITHDGCFCLLETYKRKRGVIEVPEAVWEVLKEQARTLAVQSESLAVRDRQVDELIGIIKKREGADVKGIGRRLS